MKNIIYIQTLGLTNVDSVRGIQFGGLPPFSKPIEFP
jgi:hypothetical protein